MEQYKENFESDPSKRFNEPFELSQIPRPTPPAGFSPPPHPDYVAPSNEGVVMPPKPEDKMELIRKTAIFNAKNNYAFEAVEVDENSSDETISEFLERYQNAVIVNIGLEISNLKQQADYDKEELDRLSKDMDDAIYTSSYMHHDSNMKGFVEKYRSEVGSIKEEFAPNKSLSLS